MKRKLTIKTPGKLMVAGEYAVLEPYHPLIVMAVDRFVYTSIQDNDINVVTLENFNLHELQWNYNENEVVFQSNDIRLRFVKDAMTVALTYLHENNIETSPFSLVIKSELDDQGSGIKYGLGSSAAVVTSVISAILEKFSVKKLDRQLLFKLAAISHIRTQGNGSGADIAASTYGGVLLYSSFQAEWLKMELEKERSITALVQKDWTYLTIQEVQFPTSIQLCIGWTGTPASTANLVQQISLLKQKDIDQYEQFLHNSKLAVQHIINGMKHNDSKLFFTGIKLNRETLSVLGKRANVDIETEKLFQLSMDAEKLGGAGKLSGAGGGDCGIAFLPLDISCEKLHALWEENGIKPLYIRNFSHGTMLKNE